MNQPNHKNNSRRVKWKERVKAAQKRTERRDEETGGPKEEGRDRHRILRNEYFKNPRVIRRMAGEPYIWGQRKDGNRLPLDVRVNPIATRDGTRVIASLIDISHHQALEASLREQVVQRENALELGGAGRQGLG